MKIIFMGTPDFAVPSLEKLLSSSHEVTAVFTQPDKPKGRGYKLTPPPVKVLAQEYNLPIYQPSSLKGDEVFQVLQSYTPDVIIVAAYGKILPASILHLPKYGCINIHASILPKYRGAAPIQWSIINGEEETGVTIMQMDEGLDTGKILSITKTLIGENETASELFNRLAELGGDALIATLGDLALGKVHPVEQDEAKATFTTKITKDMCIIDFSKPAQEVHNFIRGLSSFPGAKTQLDGKVFKIYKTTVCKDKDGEAGTIIDAKRFIVACGNDSIQLHEVQLFGSRRMTTQDFLNGNRVQLNQKLG